MSCDSRQVERRRTVTPGFAVLCLCALALLTGCGVQIYNFGGPGQGTQFHVPSAAAMNPSPIVQSWIAYSLTKSTCQLEIGGDKPSQNSSFECELRPREVLVKRWATRDPSGGNASPDTTQAEQDEYLDLLVRIEEAGFLEEYVWVYLRERSWPQPDWLELSEFDRWRKANLGFHRPQTRIIGYWASP